MKEDQILLKRAAAFYLILFLCVIGIVMISWNVKVTKPFAFLIGLLFLYILIVGIELKDLKKQRLNIRDAYIVLINPRVFFMKRSELKPSYSFVVVLLTLQLLIISFLVVVLNIEYTSFDVFNQEKFLLLSNDTFSVIVSNILTLPVITVFTAGLLQLFSKIFKTDLSQNDIVNIVPYSFAPVFLFGLIPYLSQLSVVYSIYITSVGISINKRIKFLKSLIISLISFSILIIYLI